MWCGCVSEVQDTSTVYIPVLLCRPVSELVCGNPYMPLFNLLVTSLLYLLTAKCIHTMYTALECGIRFLVWDNETWLKYCLYGAQQKETLCYFSDFTHTNRIADSFMAWPTCSFTVDDYMYACTRLTSRPDEIEGRQMKLHVSRQSVMVLAITVPHHYTT